MSEISNPLNAAQQPAQNSAIPTKTQSQPQSQAQSAVGDGPFSLLYAAKLMEAMSAFQQSAEVFRQARNGYQDGKLTPKAIRKLWEQGHMVQAMPKETAEKLSQTDYIETPSEPIYFTSYLDEA